MTEYTCIAPVDTSGEQNSSSSRKHIEFFVSCFLFPKLNATRCLHWFAGLEQCLQTTQNQAPAACYMLKDFTVIDKIVMYHPQAAHITEILNLETYS
jgi:hypothetical protein